MMTQSNSKEINDNTVIVDSNQDTITVSIDDESNNEVLSEIDKTTFDTVQSMEKEIDQSNKDSLSLDSNNKEFFNNLDVDIQDGEDKHLFYYTNTSNVYKHVSRIRVFRLLLKHNGDLEKVIDELKVNNKEIFYSYYYNHLPVASLNLLFKQRLINKSMSVLWDKVNNEQNENVAQFVVKTLGKNILYSESPLVSIDQRDVKLTPSEMKKEVYDVFGIEPRNKTVQYNEDGTLKVDSPKMKKGRPKGVKNGQGKQYKRRIKAVKAQEERRKKIMENQYRNPSHLLKALDKKEEESNINIDTVVYRNTVDNIVNEK